MLGESDAWDDVGALGDAAPFAPVFLGALFFVDDCASSVVASTCVHARRMSPPSDRGTFTAAIRFSVPLPTIVSFPTRSPDNDANHRSV